MDPAETAKAPAPEPAPRQPQTVTVTLGEPLRRTGGDITELTLRKPRAGELRGLKVEDLFGTDVNTLIVLLPRITSPVIAAHEVEMLEADDLLEVAGAVKGFFMPASLREAMAKALGG